LGHRGWRRTASRRGRSSTACPRRSRQIGPGAFGASRYRGERYRESRPARSIAWAILHRRHAAVRRAQFIIRIRASPTDGPFGANKLVYNDEFVATEIGQVGTQFDGLGHIGVQLATTATRPTCASTTASRWPKIGHETGLKKLGVEKLKPIVGRGILLDIAGARGVEAMDVGQEITMADVQSALRRQTMANFRFQPGDVVLFRTG